MPTTGGTIHRAWMDVKVTFFGRNSNSLLNTCLFGEEAVQKAYKEAVQVSEGFPEEIRDLIRTQKSLLRMSQDLICNMKINIRKLRRLLLQGHEIVVLFLISAGSFPYDMSFYMQSKSAG